MLSNSLPESPPAGVKNFNPFLSHGWWLAVICTAPSQPSVCVVINIAGVEHSAQSRICTPHAVSSFKTAAFIRSADTRESCPTDSFKSPTCFAVCTFKNRTNAPVMRRTASSVKSIFSGFSGFIAVPRTSVPLFKCRSCIVFPFSVSVGANWVHPPQGFDHFAERSRPFPTPAIQFISYVVSYSKCRFSSSSAASNTPTLPVWKFKPPCIHTANGSRSGASPDSSIDEPEVNAPAAIMTWLS